MKKIIYNILSVLILLTTLTFISCSEDPTASLYDVIEPPAPIPVARYYDFNDKAVPKEQPYGIAVDAQGIVYVSLNGLGIKKIVADTLAPFSPAASNAPFFKSIVMVYDTIYGVRGGIRGIYKVSPNTAPATFVAGSNGIVDNVSDIDFDKTRNVFWAGGSEGNVYRITLNKNIKRYQISGNISAVEQGYDNLFVAIRDTNSQELVWKFPIVSADSLGTPELYFNYTQNIDTTGRITDIALDQDGGLYICSNIEPVALYLVRPDKSFSEFYDGLIKGSIYSFTWGIDNNAYFTNILLNINTDVWKVDMKKQQAQ